MSLSKRKKQLNDLVDPEKVYSIDEAVEILKKAPPVKFDQSIELALRMGVDPRKADQNVRGTIGLPNGTGKNIRLVALVKGDKAQEATDAGAEYVGAEDLVEKIKGGWTDFDALITTPDMMREVGKLGKVLGPRGLMPTPKAGSVTTDVAKAIKEIKGGKVEFKLDRHGIISNAVGKLSFASDKIKENLLALLQAVARAKPPGAKGQYMRSAAVSPTMGPGVKIDLREVE